MTLSGTGMIAHMLSFNIYSCETHMEQNFCLVERFMLHVYVHTGKHCKLISHPLAVVIRNQRLQSRFYCAYNKVLSIK